MLKGYLSYYFNMSDKISNNGDHPPSDSDENTNKVYNEIKSFDELSIDENLLRGIYSMGFEWPSAIQRKAIAPIVRYRRLDCTSSIRYG